MSTIQPVRTRYRGTWFASTLEADWAATFDTLGWHWEYEPVAVKLPNGEAYRPDFRLPSQRVWAEVKGPHNERIVKPELLQQALGYDEWEETWQYRSDLVVVLRPPGPGEGAMWHGTSDVQDIVIVRCCHCDNYSFLDHYGLWTCRYHPAMPGQTNKFWSDAPDRLAEFYHPGGLAFTRAPRPERRAA